jgi:hypothetical protein
MHAHTLSQTDESMQNCSSLTSIGPRLVAAMFAHPAFLRPLLTLPLAVQVCGTIYVVRTADDLARMVSIKRADWKRRGMGQVTGQVTACELPRKGRYRLWLALVQPCPGAATIQEDYVLYCRETAKGPRIEMIDCLPPETGQTALAGNLRASA